MVGIQGRDAEWAGLASGVENVARAKHVAAQNSSPASPISAGHHGRGSQDPALRISLSRLAEIHLSFGLDSFGKVAKVFDPTTGILPRTEEIDSDGYDDAQWAVQERRQKLSKGLHDWANFLQPIMIWRTHKDQIWGSPLLTMPMGFYDVDGAVRDDYYMVMSKAMQQMLEQQYKISEGTQGANHNSVVNIYQWCHTASSVPALCSITAFKNSNYNEANVTNYRMPGERTQRPSSDHLDSMTSLPMISVHFQEPLMKNS
ncbi:hypothetical protein L873DRAFT_1792306 [Choiromyces venosus 120613-1]|uniref:Uncharacterized protein n=1 Tax=Choiromyces venosus 120613-1 TaxID=1336337 RepID=A0A3N4JEM1_9PEZI|nr:hypothetical protein L873DRAFT_1792306 [Choiromyces venosus 120613-1]